MWDDLTPPYSAIVADPPWHYETTGRRNAESGYGIDRPLLPLPYSSMTLDEIGDLPVGDLTEHGRCFLWVTNRYLHDGPDILRAWGFEPQTRVLVWCKPPMGTCNVTTEFVLIGKRGNPPRLPWHGTTWFQWPRSSHSSKPSAFGDLVEAWCPGPYVELFARQPRLGWDHWGYGHEGVRHAS